MPSPDEIRTPRLILTRMRESELADLCRMYADPQVTATLGGVRSEDLTRKNLRKHMDHWDLHGFGWWAARALDTGRFAGCGGLRHIVVGGRDEVEVGYGFMPEFWGRGLATELASLSVKVAFDDLGLSELVCFTLPTNAASRRVMEKAGFRFECDIVHAELPHVLYRLTAASRSSAAG